MIVVKSSSVSIILSTGGVANWSWTHFSAHFNALCFFRGYTTRPQGIPWRAHHWKRGKPTACFSKIAKFSENSRSYRLHKIGLWPRTLWPGSLTPAGYTMIHCGTLCRRDGFLYKPLQLHCTSWLIVSWNGTKSKSSPFDFRTPNVPNR